MKIQRYDQTDPLNADDYGDIVRYSDHVAVVDELKRERDALQEWFDSAISFAGFALSESPVKPDDSTGEDLIKSIIDAVRMESKDDKAKLASDHAAEVERLKVRGDCHAETLRGIAAMDPSTEASRMKQWARDGLSGYMETTEATVKRLSDEINTLTAENAALREAITTIRSFDDEPTEEIPVDIIVEDVRAVYADLTASRARCAELEGVIQGFREHMVAAVTVGEIDEEEREYIIGILDGCVAISTQTPSK